MCLLCTSKSLISGKLVLIFDFPISQSFESVIDLCHQSIIELYLLDRLSLIFLFSLVLFSLSSVALSPSLSLALFLLAVFLLLLSPFVCMCVFSFCLRC